MNKRSNAGSSKPGKSDTARSINRALQFISTGKNTIIKTIELLCLQNVQILSTASYLLGDKELLNDELSTCIFDASATPAFCVTSKSLSMVFLNKVLTTFLCAMEATSPIVDCK